MVTKAQTKKEKEKKTIVLEKIEINDGIDTKVDEPLARVWKVFPYFLSFNVCGPRSSPVWKL